MQQERAVRTCEAILDAAAAAFDEQGYQAASLADICERAGVTKGALYFHFRSKLALSAALVEDRLTKWTAFAAEIEERMGSPLRALCCLLIEASRRTRDDTRLRAALRLEAERVNLGEGVPTPFSTWHTILNDLLERARRDGELVDGLNLDAIAWVLVSTLFGVQLIADASEATVEKRTYEALQLLLPAMTGDLQFHMWDLPDNLGLRTFQAPQPRS